MSTFKSATELLGTGHRSMVLLGSPKTGKTTFVCSGCNAAADTVETVPQSIIEASDVLLIQRDAEGHLGPVDLGYRPLVADVSGVEGWPALNSALAGIVQEAAALSKAGGLRVVGIDLSTIASEIVVWAAGNVTIPKGKLTDDNITYTAQKGQGMPVDWNKVSATGIQLYRAMRSIQCLVVAQCHVKLSMNNPMASQENANAQLGRDIAAVGGDVARVSADVAKGLLAPWLANSSFIFARDVDSVVDPKTRTRKKVYSTLTSPDGVYQVGNRRQSVLPAKTDLSLRKLMEMAYEVKK